jgi:predicted dehydrogenase
MSDPKLSRRAFVAAVPLATLRSRRVFAANDRIQVAVMGCGERGLLGEVLQFHKETGADVAVVCDTWRLQREKAAAAVKKATGREPKMVTRYQDVLAMPEVNAVVISTPDHVHCAMLRDAVRAGKDVYIEKPLAMNIGELNEAVDAVHQSGRIVQVGTQVRSFPSSVAAQAFVRAGGLGKIFRVEQSRNAYRPYWHHYAARPVREEDVDWEAFLGAVPHRPFNADQYAAWYGYREFSLGPQTGLMSHFVDLVHFITGAQLPKRVTASGGIYRWKDARTAPDSFDATLEYPDDGFVARYSTTFGTDAQSYLKFFGTRGSMDATAWNKPWLLTPESEEPERVREGARIPERTSTPHMKNWLECVRSRREPAASIDAGYRHSVACLMADESWVRGTRMTFDAGERRILPG